MVIGVQFWYADQGGVYVLWYLPLLLLMVFRPNLSDRRPPLINPETDWLRRGLRSIRKRLRAIGPSGAADDGGPVVNWAMVFAMDAIADASVRRSTM